MDVPHFSNKTHHPWPFEPVGACGPVHHGMMRVYNCPPGVISALMDDDGVKRSGGASVHAILHHFGQKQNAASPAIDAGFRALLGLVTPAWRDASCDGGAWEWRTALPYPVFLRILRGMRGGKAVALHPFVIEMLQALPDEHPGAPAARYGDMHMHMHMQHTHAAS